MNTNKQTSGLPTPALPTVGEPRITRKEARDAMRALAWLARQFLADLRATLGGMR